MNKSEWVLVDRFKLSNANDFVHVQLYNHQALGLNLEDYKFITIPKSGKWGRCYFCGPSSSIMIDGRGYKELRIIRKRNLTVEARFDINYVLVPMVEGRLAI